MNSYLFIEWNFLFHVGIVNSPDINGKVGQCLMLCSIFLFYNRRHCIVLQKELSERYYNNCKPYYLTFTMYNEKS